jgi:hypothetical protein
MISRDILGSFFGIKTIKLTTSRPRHFLSHHQCMSRRDCLLHMPVICPKKKDSNSRENCSKIVTPSYLQ